MLTLTITITAGGRTQALAPINMTPAQANQLISAFSTSFDVSGAPADRVTIEVNHGR